ncbi:MAG TPA: tetratricopeptide repeat protein [Alphaproteobacteria bacterium]
MATPVDSRQTLSDALRQHQAGRLAEAEASYRVVLKDDPANPDALHLLGVLRHQQGDSAAAESLIRQAIAINPNAPMFHNNMGKTLAEKGDRPGALASYRRAIELAPDYAEAHYNHGVCLQADGDYVAAEAAYRRALGLAPANDKAAVNLGAALLGQGRPQEAILALRHALTVKPDDADTYRLLLTALLYDPTADAGTYAAEHRRFAGQFAALRAPAPAPANPRDPERRLRIGWVSSDFRDHPVARNLEPIFTHRDRSRFETVCYAEVAKPDATTARYKSLADSWRSIVGRTDRDVAELIRSDGIDILIILAGRFDHNRPLIAAYRPAPIQISFHDPGTSGLSAIDYLIADPVLAPPRTDEAFAERILYLPSFYIHEPLRDAPPVGPPPSAVAGHVAFGSFNNPVKVNDSVLGLWGGILRQVPRSRLQLKYRNRFGPLRGRIDRVLAAESVAADRLELSDEALAHAGHLALYNRIDIALDPFPFTGSTTTFEALWMGVPVVTLAGRTMASRWSASILHALKLDELIAHSLADYVAKAVALANDLPRLAELRSTLRARVANSPLCDGRGRTRQIERLLRAVWRRWCDPR